jgi:hypothetical protein
MQLLFLAVLTPPQKLTILVYFACDVSHRIWWSDRLMVRFTEVSGKKI